jgi:hypothetical protein
MTDLATKILWRAETKRQARAKESRRERWETLGCALALIVTAVAWAVVWWVTMHPHITRLTW